MLNRIPNYLDLRDRNRSFDGLAAYTIEAAGLDTGDNPSRVWLELVSGNYFDVLRLQPYLGRFFHGSDEHGPNSAPYIVLSYGYWRTHFQDDRRRGGPCGPREQASVHHPRRGAAGVSRDGVVFLSRFLRADGEPGAG